MPEAPSMREVLGHNPPTNWGKWGPDDELGDLNYYAAAPLKVVSGTEAPVNPLAIR